MAVMSIAIISMKPIGKPIRGNWARITGISTEPTALITKVARIDRIEISVIPTAR